MVRSLAGGKYRLSLRKTRIREHCVKMSTKIIMVHDDVINDVIRPVSNVCQSYIDTP